MRKYSLADGNKRGIVDLRDYEDVIVAAVAEFAPGIKVSVQRDCYIINGQLTQSQAVKIGRRICESSLSKHCIKLSKLFNSKIVKENVNDDSRKEQQQIGGHY